MAVNHSAPRPYDSNQARKPYTVAGLAKCNGQLEEMVVYDLWRRRKGPILDSEIQNVPLGFSPSVIVTSDSP